MIGFGQWWWGVLLWHPTWKHAVVFAIGMVFGIGLTRMRRSHHSWPQP